MECLKILLSAYACRPELGSEPGVGWNAALEVAKYHQVWVFTREDNRSSIEAYFQNNASPQLNFIYYDLPGSKWWNKNLRLVYLHYYLWQVGVYFLAQKIHQKIDFDLVHHVTYVRYSSPSFLSLLPIPFVWGPVGGGESAPKTFWQDFSLYGKIYEFLRDLASRIGESDPFVWLTARKSLLIQATTVDTAKRIAKIGGTNIKIASQLGLSQTEIAQLAPATKEDSSVKFISVGRLLHWKGFHLGIHAFALANLPDDCEYWIVGDGVENYRLQMLAKKLKIAHKVKFWGSLSREETLKRLKKSQVLIHPSLHESGGLVCLEAMAAKMPVICLDLGGPAIQVTEKTGFKISADTSEQAVKNIARAMTCLVEDSQLRFSMGRAARERVKKHYSWANKGKQLAQLYQEIVN